MTTTYKTAAIGCRIIHIHILSILLILLLLLEPISAWSTTSTNNNDKNSAHVNRREYIIKQISTITTSTILLINNNNIQPAIAYTPDTNPLRESLYYISRVQEATVQQERFINKATKQDVLKNKMKLTLRLVEKNYKLLDQITYCAEYVKPESKVIEATTAGYTATEALQNAIDYVKDELTTGDFKDGQKEYLISNLKECRECLFDFLDYMPQEDLLAARKRVEEENIANREEFDGDDDAGVYNPVVLPWKNR